MERERAFEQLRVAIVNFRVLTKGETTFNLNYDLWNYFEKKESAGDLVEFQALLEA